MYATDKVKQWRKQCTLQSSAVKRDLHNVTVNSNSYQHTTNVNIWLHHLALHSLLVTETEKKKNLLQCTDNIYCYPQGNPLKQCSAQTPANKKRPHLNTGRACHYQYQTIRPHFMHRHHTTSGIFCNQRRRRTQGHFSAANDAERKTQLFLTTQCRDSPYHSHWAGQATTGNVHDF